MASCIGSESSSSRPISTSEAAARSGLEVSWLGLKPYSEALALQGRLVEERRQGGPDRLLLLEHPPVLTLGRRSRLQNILSSRAELERAGVEVHEVARGGDVTYHGPGQLVGYAIVDLAARGGGAADVHAFLRDLEAVLIGACLDLGVTACRLDGMTGVFVDHRRSRRSQGPARKLASIGVGVRSWVSCHGFALNVDPDLCGFGHIVPCGLSQVEMTSLAVESGADVDPELARAAVQRHFEQHFG